MAQPARGVERFLFVVGVRRRGVIFGCRPSPAGGRLYETSKTGTATTRYLYDGAEVIAEYSAAGAVLRRYVRGAGADEVVVWYEGSTLADRRFLLADERGSVIAGADSAGATLFKNVYDEYGRPGSNNQGRFQYTGQMWLAEAGLYHYKARVYSPYLGRFLQTDPIGYADGLNLYAYVGGDPVNNTDPSGLIDEVVVSGARTCVPKCNEPSSPSFPGGGGGQAGGNGGESGAGGFHPEVTDVVVTQATRTPRASAAAPAIVFAGGNNGEGGGGGPSREPTRDEIREILFNACINDVDALTAGLTGATLFGAGQNFIDTSAKFKGATPGTSPLAEFGRFLDRATGNAASMPQNPIRNSITGTIQSGVRFTRSSTVGSFSARAAPVIGLGLGAIGFGAAAGCAFIANDVAG